MNEKNDDKNLTPSDLLIYTVYPMVITYKCTFCKRIHYTQTAQV